MVISGSAHAGYGAGSQPLLCKRLRRFGTTEVISLRLIAIQRQQGFRLFRFFHTFGKRFQSEAVYHADDGGDDGVVVVILDHVAHERDVDLEPVCGQAFEIGERRVAGAKIVD